MALITGTHVGPYEIAGLLGEGGMGEVYRARDGRLGREVAIKVLPQAVAADAGRLRRFETEARATGSLNHPNVLAIHDVGVHEGQPYLVEELLEGQTLRELLDDGPLPPRKAVEYAVQIAAGLAAAHGRGIVHRDLKPANLFVTGDGHVKILDFGLAKLVIPEDPVDAETVTDDPGWSTQSGRVLGTVGYMAPEQVRGQPVDHRTDIFAFGCVLYEMVSGSRAFRRDTSADTMTAILTADPGPLRTGVPGSTKAVIRHCLEKRPDDRFQSARDLAFALQGALETEVGAVGAGQAPAARTIGLRLRVRTAAVAGLVVLVAAIAWLGRHRLVAPPLPEAKHLAVVAFATQGRDGNLPATALGLSEYVSRGLAQIAPDQPTGYWTVPTAEARRLKAGTAADLRRKFNVTLAIAGRLERSGDRLRLELDVLDAASGRTLRSALVEDSTSNPVSFQVGLIARIAGLAGLTAARDPADRLAAMSTTIPAAFLSYLEAAGILVEATATPDIDRAVGLLEAATARDPLYAAGWTALGRACLRRFEVSREAGWLDRAASAAERAASTGKWPDEALRLAAAVASARGGTGDAVGELEQALRISPGDAELHGELASAYRAAGRPADAERELERAVFLQPGYWQPHHQLAKLYLSQGRNEAAATQWRAAIADAPECIYPYSNLGAVYNVLGRSEEARQAFERSLAIEPNRVAFSNLGTLYFEDARFADAAAMFERALAIDGASHKTWGNLGFAYRYAASPEKATAAFRRARELAEASLAQAPGDLVLATDLANYHAMLGERELGLNVIAAVIGASPSDPGLIGDVAECLWDLEDRERAFEWVGRAFAAGVSRRRFEKRPTLHGLVADPRYQRLVAEHESRS